MGIKAYRSGLMKSVSVMCLVSLSQVAFAGGVPVHTKSLPESLDPELLTITPPLAQPPQKQYRARNKLDMYPGAKPKSLQYSKGLPKTQSSEPSKSLAFLMEIPADKLPTDNERLEVLHDVEIERMSHSDPFPEIDEELVDETVGSDIELDLLDIEVSDAQAAPFKKVQLAHEALSAGQIESAIAYYNQVIGEEPKNQDALFGIATAYHRGGQLEEAREYYMQVITANQEHWPALNNFLVLVSQESPNNAIKELKEIERSNPEFAPVPAQLGMIYIQREEYEMAAKSLTRAVILDPDNTTYRYHLAVLLDHVGNAEVASRLYRQLITAAQEGKSLPVEMSELKNRLNSAMSEQALN